MLPTTKDAGGETCHDAKYEDSSYRVKKQRESRAQMQARDDVKQKETKANAA